MRLKNMWVPSVFQSTAEVSKTSGWAHSYNQFSQNASWKWVTGDGKSWFEANQCPSIHSFCSHIHVMVTGRPESSLPKMLSRSFSLFVWIQTKGGFQVRGPLQAAPFKAKMQRLDMEAPLNCSTAVGETLFLLSVSTLLSPNPKSVTVGEAQNGD